jgi:hypothetical protein
MVVKRDISYLDHGGKFGDLYFDALCIDYPYFDDIHFGNICLGASFDDLILRQSFF